MSGAEGYNLPPLRADDGPPEDNSPPPGGPISDGGRVMSFDGDHWKSPEAEHVEKVILGLCLVEESVIPQARSLDREDFAFDSHKLIFDAILAVADAGERVDYITVSQHLEGKYQLSTVGGRDYLFEIGERLPRHTSIKPYVRIVRDKSALRQLMGLFYDAGLKAGDEKQDPFKLFHEIEVRLSELASTTLRVQRDRKVLVGAMEFIREAQAEIDWSVEGLIQRGGNGVIVGDPKSAKSFSSLDLAYHMVAGSPWLGHNIPKPMKVAFIAREDHPGLTQQRGLSLLKGYQGSDTGEALDALGDLNECLYFNTRAQSETFSLQSEMDVQEMIQAFKEHGIEMAFFDVFRRLWDGDENDNKEVANVLATLTRIQSECNCSVAIIHHLSKSDKGTIFQRIRGAGAIFGWNEWAFGISVENPDADPKDRIRKIEFESKVGGASPVWWCFDGEVENVRISTCSPPAKSYSKSKGKGKAEPEQQAIPWYEGDNEQN